PHPKRQRRTGRPPFEPSLESRHDPPESPARAEVLNGRRRFRAGAARAEAPFRFGQVRAGDDRSGPTPSRDAVTARRGSAAGGGLTRAASRGMARSVSGSRDRFVEAPGARLRLRDDGSGPAVVLVHGWAWDLELWEPLLARLSAHCRLIRVDR